MHHVLIKCQWEKDFRCSNRLETRKLRAGKWLPLVDPAVGAGGRLFPVLVDVDLEAFAIAAVLPVSDGIADVVKERTAAQIKIAYKHTAEMADVADVIARRTEQQRKKELHASQDQHKRTHGKADRQKEDAHLPVREQNRASRKDTEDGPGGADGRDERRRAAKESRYGLNQDLNEPRADSSQKVIADKSRLAPEEFQLAAEHPQHEHVKDNVQKVRGVMEKEVGERLPDTKSAKNGGGHEADPEQHFVVSDRSREDPNENLQKKDREGGDDEPLNTRGDVKVEADPIVPDA